MNIVFFRFGVRLMKAICFRLLLFLVLLLSRKYIIYYVQAPREFIRMLIDKIYCRYDSMQYKINKCLNYKRLSFVQKKMRKLNILTYRWHSAHQYELFKLGHHFTLATGSGTSMCDFWDDAQRPMPSNVRFKPLCAIDIKKYDFAILPFDEDILRPEASTWSLPMDWGQGFQNMLAFTKDLPRTAICHGTPQCCDMFVKESEGGAVLRDRLAEANRMDLRDLVKDVHVVCNSHQAQREWEFHKSSVIWHGFSPQEFPAGTHAKACLTLPRSAFETRPEYRGREHLERAITLLNGICEVKYTTPPEPHTCYEKGTQEWAVAKFRSYTSYIGEFAVYLNPTVHSPMPRSRGEAMMTGTIPVTLRNHDVDMFIQNGVNGFYGDTAEELAKYITWLMKNEKQRDTINKNARRTAMDLFNIDRYLAEWGKLIATLC